MCCTWVDRLVENYGGQLRDTRCLWLSSIICLPVTGPLFLVVAAVALYFLTITLFISTPFVLATCCCCCFCGERKHVAMFAAAWGVWLALVLSPVVLALLLALYPVTVGVAVWLCCRVSRSGARNQV